MNIKTVVIYIPMPKYSPNCIYPFTIWRIPDCGRSLNLENNQFWVKFLQKITSRRSIKTTQPKNDLLLVKNMYFGWYRYYRYSRGGFRSFWLVPGQFQVVLGGFSWFQIASGGFRPSLVLVSRKRLNVGLDLMCSFLCKNLLHIAFVQNFNRFDFQPLETLE